MFEEFKAKAEGVGAEVHRFPTVSGALEFISGLLRQEGVADAPGSYAVWAKCPFFEATDPKERQGTAGLKFEVNRALASQARIGISQVDWAVADTGSLVQDQSDIAQRLVSSLTEIHVALLPTGNIVEDKRALFRKLSPATSRYLAFITGPSRTADIERVLTIGVHGPQRLVVVCVDDLGGQQ